MNALKAKPAAGMNNEPAADRWDAFTSWELEALNEFFRSFGPMRDYSNDIQKIGREIAAAVPRRSAVKTVLIAGHYAPEVRRTLLLVQAEPENGGKSLKQLLGEAINDLCAKYGKPQPYSGEE